MGSKQTYHQPTSAGRCSPRRRLSDRPRSNLSFGLLLSVCCFLLGSFFGGSVTRGFAADEDSVDVAPPSTASTTAVLVDESPIPTKNLLNVIRDGGIMMIPIGICSFALLVFVFERAVSLRRGRVIPRPFTRRVISQLSEGQLSSDDILELCEENRSPVATVFAATIKKWGRPAVEVEQAMIDAGERVTNELRRYLRLFNGISTISPLLGLLGTVLGMIRAFNAIATSDAMGRPERLADGISQALLTTAAGLSVAIPAFIAYQFFAGRVDRLTMEIDDLGQQLVDHMTGDSRNQKAANTTKKQKKAA